MLLATTGHMSYLAAEGPALVLFNLSLKRRFSSVQAFLSFIKDDVNERWDGTSELLARQRNLREKESVPRRELKRAQRILDAIDPPSTRTKAGKAFSCLDAILMFGPESELEDSFLNETAAPFLAAAQFAKLDGLVGLLRAVQAELSGKTWGARSKQMRSERAQGAVEDVCSWAELHGDDLTIALAAIATDAGWAPDA
jgi:hypothetical protein